MISFLKNTLLIFIIICNFLNCKINQNNPEEDKEPLDLTKLEKGIDVSHHQGKINWKKVKSSGIEFTFIKASDGLNFHDSKFLFNWKESKKYGIKRGAYHFFRLCKDGIKQAENFISIVPKDKNMLPPVIDLELFRNCEKENIIKEDLLKEIYIYLNKIKSHYGMNPIIYYEYDFYIKYMMGEFNEFDLWVADPFHDEEPFVPESRSWVYWQYSTKGKVDGINGPVDLNYKFKK